MLCRSKIMEISKLLGWTELSLIFVWVYAHLFVLSWDKATVYLLTQFVSWTGLSLIFVWVYAHRFVLSWDKATVYLLMQFVSCDSVCLHIYQVKKFCKPISVGHQKVATLFKRSIIKIM